MRRFFSLLFLVVILLSLSVPQLTARDNLSPILQVVDSDPISGQEMGLTDSITLYFDRPLDCESLPSAFSITPTVEGDIECNRGRMIFTPSTSYERATTYIVRLSESLLGEDGAQLLEPYELELNTVGFLAVSEVFPAAANGVQADAVITVIFNRPVVPLVDSTQSGSLPQPLLFEPTIEGTGAWLNTSIYEFTPRTELAGGTTYAATVSEGLSAVDGSFLPEEYTWSFTTQLPEITSIEPAPNSGDVDLFRQIQVTFNQPMDRDSIEASFFLKPNTADQLSVSGEFEWSPDSTGFGFTPDELLQIDAFYIAGFDGDVLSKVGHVPLNGVTSWSFTTVPFPSITGSEPVDGSDDVSPSGGVSIYFASLMDAETLDGKVTIEPEPEREPNTYYSDWNNRYTVSFSTLPSTTYTVTVEPGMKDVYGNRVTEGYSFSFTTGAYAPDLGLQVPGSVGFYSAYREPTQLFVFHRNVSQLDLSLYNVDVERFVDRLTDEDYYDPTQNYRANADELIRSWTMLSSVPENLTRYDLLNLTNSPDTNVECVGAMPARLKIGDRAIVVTEPDPLRARSTPVTGEIVDLLYKDYALTIVGGPVCEDGVLWWEVELRDEVRAWVAEGIDDEYFMDVRSASTPTEVTVSPSEDSRALEPGLYFLNVTSPETIERNYNPTRHFLMVSTTVMTVKASIDSVTVWATDVQSGLPVVGEAVSFYDSFGGFIGESLTDSQGIARTQTPRAEDLFARRVAVIDSDETFGLGFSEWENGIGPWVFGQNYEFYPSQYRVYVYTDRPIYRPDQPVYFRGIIRDKDDVRYTPPQFDTVPVEITDDRGEIIYSEELPITDFGTFSGQFDLSPDAPLGYYRINAEITTSNRNRREGGGVSFTVGEFRLPEYQVNVTPLVPAVVQDNSLQVEVDSQYFFGGPVSNASVDYSVVARPYFFRYSGEGFYNFTTNREGCDTRLNTNGGFITEGVLRTDAQGQVTINVPAALEDVYQSQTFTVEAVVQDEGNQAIAGRTDVIVHQGQVYIGVRPENYVSTAGDESKVNIIAVDWESNPIANQEVEVEVVECRWSSIQEQDDRGRTTWTWEREEINVTDGVIITDSDGNASFDFTPPNGGTFRIEVKSRDELGNEIRSSASLWVSSREYVSWRQDNGNAVDLIADQQEYEVGDTAKILITSPFQGTTEALLTIERGDVLSVEHVSMDSNSYVYEFEIEPDHAPNIFVSVFLVKGVDENNPLATFRMGIVRLDVDISHKELHIDIQADREQASPQETVTYTVETTDYKGDPVSAEVGVAVTDLASLSILGPNSGPLLDFFYSPQGLGIRTSTSLTIDTDEITAALTEAKGGGGGLFDAGIVDIRGEFIDTPYWNPTLVTDENGQATIDVRLPDNLTTWRLDARAITDGRDGVTLVGQDTFDLLSTRPLIMRPQTPRFFVIGDEVTLAAVINNNTDEDLEVVVTLDNIEGIQLVDQLTQQSQKVTIPAKGRVRIIWEAVIGDVHQVKPIFSVRSMDDRYSDGSISPVSLDDSGTLPVYRFEVPETIGTAGVLRTEDTRVESIVLPQRFAVTNGELNIKVDQSLAATTVDGLDFLRNYPHQCIEQTVSRFLPNIMTFRALNELGLADARLEAGLNNAVNFALQKLYAEQKIDGGWGWFVQDDSSPLTTAYALIGLVEAQKQGYAVDDAVFQRAQGFLRAKLVIPSLSRPEWQLNRQAFMLYALARSGTPDVARTVTLYDARARLNLYAKALLAQTLHAIDPADTTRTDVLVSDLISEAIVSATGAHWEEGTRDFYNWNTNTRSTAIILSTLIKLRPDSDLLPNVVRYLVTHRTLDAWETTQETAWAVMALTDWMMATGELQPSYDYSVTLNDDALTEGSATPATVRDRHELVVDVSDLLRNEANNIFFERTDGDGALYYTAHLRLDLPVPEVEPLNRGIILERRYTLLEDKSETPISEAHVGEVVQVRLTIIAPNDLHYVVIEDPIPAGADAINPNLETSQQVGTRPGLSANNPLSRGWGWWWFSNIEFRDEKVVLYSSFLPAGTYEYVYTIRPGVEGIYNVIPVTGQEFYFPEVYGRSAGSTFTILPFES